MKTKILLIDDHDLVLKGLLAVLRSALPDAGFLTARSGQEAIEAVRGTRADLAVLDLELPDIPGFRLIELLRGEVPDILIVVNTVHEEIWTLRHLEQSGVDGVVFKSVDSSSLVRTIRRVLECRHNGSGLALPGQKHPEPELPAVPATSGESGNKDTGCSTALSPKELEVLHLVASGMDTRRIADTLYITVNTVESHRRHIMRKLGAVNAADMTMKAIALGLIPPARLK